MRSPDRCHAFPAMMDSVPLELYATMNPLFSKLLLVLVFHHRNRKVTNTVGNCSSRRRPVAPWIKGSTVPQAPSCPTVFTQLPLPRASPSPRLITCCHHEACRTVPTQIAKIFRNSQAPAPALHVPRKDKIYRRLLLLISSPHRQSGVRENQEKTQNGTRKCASSLLFSRETHWSWWNVEDVPGDLLHCCLDKPRNIG